jgi:hypothetical protein
MAKLYLEGNCTTATFNVKINSSYEDESTNLKSPLRLGKNTFNLNSGCFL